MKVEPGKSQRAQSTLASQYESRLQGVDGRKDGLLRCQSSCPRPSHVRPRLIGTDASNPLLSSSSNLTNWVYFHGMDSSTDWMKTDVVQSSQIWNEIAHHRLLRHLKRIYLVLVLARSHLLRLAPDCQITFLQMPEEFVWSSFELQRLGCVYPAVESRQAMMQLWNWYDETLCWDAKRRRKRPLVWMRGSASAWHNAQSVAEPWGRTSLMRTSRKTGGWAAADTTSGFLLHWISKYQPGPASASTSLPASASTSPPASAKGSASIESLLSFKSLAVDDSC